MTPTEKFLYKSLFPNLDVDKVIVTDEATNVYNCVSWSVGITTQPHWPGSTLAEFDAFYRQFGYARSSNGPLAVWGHSWNKMTHASISGPGHGPRWESKCGVGIRIQHGLSELVGTFYGRVIAFYAKQPGLGNEVAQLLGENMKEKTTRSYLSSAQKKALREEIQAIPAELRQKFEGAFDAWKQTWYRGSLLIISDPHMRAVGQEYDALVMLGPKILPLLVEKLADPDNYLALQLYDAVQPDPNLVVYFAPDDVRILEGETGRARRTVQAWFTNR
jgi:hypothetical protein